MSAPVVRSVIGFGAVVCMVAGLALSSADLLQTSIILSALVALHGAKE